MQKCSLFLAVPWRSGEDAGLVNQGSVVRAPVHEIYHSISGLLSFKKSETVLWTIAKYYYYYYYEFEYFYQCIMTFWGLRASKGPVLMHQSHLVQN